MRFANLLVVAALGLIVFAAQPKNSERGGSVAGLRVLTEPRLESEASKKAGGDSTSADKQSGKQSDKQSFGIHIRRPDGPPLVELDAVDPQGRVGQVACSTCHSIREPNFDNKYDAALDTFHQGLTVNHGKLACYACHNPGDLNSLRSADGAKISYRDVMTLCAQCHSSQAISFAHGAHGGMNGFWDTSRGAQTKNNCIDCHNPHAPRYPKMIVDFKPRDRFLEGKALHDDHP